jgi:hypothetical protein
MNHPMMTTAAAVMTAIIALFAEFQLLQRVFTVAYNLHRAVLVALTCLFLNYVRFAEQMLLLQYAQSIQMIAV